MVDNMHIAFKSLLHALQNVEPTAAAVAFQRIRRPGNMLQLFEDKLRHNQRPFQKPGFANIRDAAVNNHTGIENFWRAIKSHVGPNAVPPHRHLACETQTPC